MVIGVGKVDELRVVEGLRNGTGGLRAMKRG